MWKKVLFASASLSLNVTGLFAAKVMFNSDSFPFPAALPFLTSLIVFLLLGMYRWCGPPPTKEESEYSKNPQFWAHLCGFGIFTGLSSGVTALSISSQDISMKEIIEASQPVFTLFTFIFFERQSVSMLQIFGIAITILGVLCSIVETPHVAWDGCAYSILIVISNAFLGSLASKISKEYPHLSTIKMMFYASPFILMVTLPIACTEGVLFSEYIVHHFFLTFQYVFISGTMLLIYQFVYLQFLECTSSLTVSMVFSLKIVVVIIISILFFEDASPPLEKCIGMAIAIIGFVLYNWSFFRKRRYIRPPIAEI